MILLRCIYAYVWVYFFNASVIQTSNKGCCIFFWQNHAYSSGAKSALVICRPFPSEIGSKECIQLECSQRQLGHLILEDWLKSDKGDEVKWGGQCVPWIRGNFSQLWSIVTTKCLCCQAFSFSGEAGNLYLMWISPIFMLAINSNAKLFSRLKFWGKIKHISVPDSV